MSEWKIEYVAEIEAWDRFAAAALTEAPTMQRARLMRSSSPPRSPIRYLKRDAFVSLRSASEGKQYAV